MRIGIDGRLWNETGVGRYIRNLVYGIDKLSTDHTFVVYLLKNEYDNLKFANPHIEKRPADIKWHTVAEQLQFPKLLEKDHLDLMHFTYYSVPFRYKKPYVITLHDLIIYYFFTGKASTLPFPLYRFKHIAYKFLLSQIKGNAKKIIVPLEATKQDVLNVFPNITDKIVVTPEGFDNHIIEKQPISDPVQAIILDREYFLYVGNAYPHKNVPRLLEAFEIFHKSHVDFKLVLVGKGDFFYKRLSSQIKNNHVIILQDVNDYELGQLYKHATTFISPSLMEGFGLPMLEAMVLQCLVLASDIPAFHEVCQDTAMYFDPHNSFAIAAIMQRAFDIDEKSKKNYLDHGLQRAKHYSWDKMVEETLAVYESCLSVR